jgi:hypothetical protein
MQIKCNLITFFLYPACTLPDEHGLGLIDDKTLRLGKSVKSQDCKTYTCLRVYETDQFDVALISEFFGKYSYST